jgi:2-polyprenyl-3-methyl-5-hydroxy-6-metoxy-1,4-benzoquinol methylase
MSGWFENESFWRDLYPFLFSEERFDAAEAQTEKIVRLVDFSGKSILDLACGPGRHAVAFAKQGYRVTGVDLSTFLLKKAKRGRAKPALRLNGCGKICELSFVTKRLISP